MAVQRPVATTAFIALAVGALVHGTVPGDARTLVYDGETLRALTSGPLGLSPADAAIRPETMTDEHIESLSADGMAATMRRAIDSARQPGFTPHVIAIDEIGNTFRDPRPRTTYKTVNVRGSQYRIASHNRIVVTRAGWRLIRSPPEPVEPGPEHPGSRFSAAMAILADTPSPWGGSYAERVHLLIAPAMVTSIGAGRGRHFTLDRGRSRAIRAAWRGVMPGVARAGGVWLQMYHGGRRSVSAHQWRRAPGRIAGYVARNGGDRKRVHLLFTSVPTAPAGISRCGTPMACQWAAARASASTRAVAANGVGAYRLGGDTREWLAGLRSG